MTFLAEAGEGGAHTMLLPARHLGDVIEGRAVLALEQLYDCADLCR